MTRIPATLDFFGDRRADENRRASEKVEWTLPWRNRLRQLAARLALFVIAALAGTGPKIAADETGSLSGHVAYTADAARPWRFARYYVKDREAGSLAEAVVALKGTNLKNWPPPAEPQTAEMDQLNFQFIPETLAIRAGDSVTFKNSDSTTHNVKSSATIATFNVSMGAEDDYTHRFERAGGLRTPVEVGCIYHGGMRAWIYVFDHPFFTVTEADGAFRFENVPPGEYTLEMIHPAGQLRWKQTIRIQAGGQTTADISVSPDDKTLQ